jgi:hypothetical protein
MLGVDKPCVHGQILNLNFVSPQKGYTVTWQQVY